MSGLSAATGSLWCHPRPATSHPREQPRHSASREASRPVIWCGRARAMPPTWGVKVKMFFLML